ncbi:MAG: hypothetical protein MJY92_02600 [Bacteroidales bacterium]|nr:hypothetical protein [Bacteroidales bacterium]
MKAIEELIAKGHYVNLGIIRCCYLVRKEEEQTPENRGLNRIMVPEPKKPYPTAMKQNLLKRRMRAAYRRRAHCLDALGIDMMFVYNTKEVIPYADIHETMGRILEKVCKAAAKS